MLIAGVVQIGSNITAYNKTIKSPTIISINKDNVINALTYTPANRSSFDWKFITGYIPWSDTNYENLSSYLTVKAASSAFLDFKLYRKGTRYYLYINGSGQITAGDAGFFLNYFKLQNLQLGQK